MDYVLLPVIMVGIEDSSVQSHSTFEDQLFEGMHVWLAPMQRQRPSRAALESMRLNKTDNNTQKRKQNKQTAQHKKLRWRLKRQATK